MPTKGEALEAQLPNMAIEERRIAEAILGRRKVDLRNPNNMLVRLDAYLAERWAGREAEVEHVQVRGNRDFNGGAGSWLVQGADGSAIGYLHADEYPVYGDGYTWIVVPPQTVTPEKAAADAARLAALTARIMARATDYDAGLCMCGHSRALHEQNVTNSACTVGLCDCMDYLSDLPF